MIMIMKTLNEANGMFFMGKNAVSPFEEEKLKIAAAKRAKDDADARKLLLELEKQKQAELEEKIKTLEMLPMGNKVILLPYPKNPYRKLIQGSLIVDYTGDFINPDSGEKDKLNELVGCAKVIEVGPEAKYVKAGDDVFYDTRTVYPVPFMSLGYILTSEPQILCFLNEQLKERITM
jgi:hypothetical protein